MDVVLEYRNTTERETIVLEQELLGLVMLHDDHTVDGSGFLGIATFGPDTRTVQAKTAKENTLDVSRAILVTRDLTLVEMSNLIKLHLGI